MKAQFWSFDVVFAMVVFSFAIVLLLLSWFDISQQFSLAYGYGVGSMQDQLQNLQSRLLFSGSPATWNRGVVATNSLTWKNVSVGFGNGDNTTLSIGKFSRFMQMSRYDYQDTKPLIGIGYEYYIVVSSPYFYNVSAGLNPLSYNAVSVQVVNREVVLDNGVPANVRIMVWTNRTFGVS